MPRAQTLLGEFLLLLPLVSSCFFLAEAFVPCSVFKSRKIKGLLLFSEWSARKDDGITSSSSIHSAVAEPPVMDVPSPTSSTKVHDLDSLMAFCDIIDNAPQDSLVAIKFYGKFCPLCKKVALKYKKMAKYYGQNAPIQFAKIEKTVHPNLFDTLEITTFPYLQIYRNRKCIASHGTESETMFERIVHSTIQQFLLMQPQDWDSFLEKFQIPIHRITQKYETIRALSNERQD